MRENDNRPTGRAIRINTSAHSVLNERFRPFDSGR